MKRIVREVSDKSLFVLRKGLIEEWKIPEDKGKKTFDPSDDDIIEQITFEQAFATWFDHPIGFIHPEYGACFIDDCSEENINEWIHDIQGSTYKGKSIIGIFHDSKTLNEAIDKCQFYQSESWPQFFEFDFPTLIRMARGE